MTSTKLPAGEYDDGQQGKGAELASFLTDGAMTKDFTPTTWPISSAYGDADRIDVLAVRYIELDGAEIIKGKIRLNADNARRLAVALSSQRTSSMGEVFCPVARSPQHLISTNHTGRADVQRFPHALPDRRVVGVRQGGPCERGGDQNR